MAWWLSVPHPTIRTAEENDRPAVGLLAGGSSARNVGLWPRAREPVVDYLEGAF